MTWNLRPIRSIGNSDPCVSPFCPSIYVHLKTQVRPFPKVFLKQSAESMGGVFTVWRVWDFRGAVEREKHFPHSFLGCVFQLATSAVWDRDRPEVGNHRRSINKHEDDEKRNDNDCGMGRKSARMCTENGESRGTVVHTLNSDAMGGV